MTLGDTVTWRARHFFIVFRTTCAITEYQFPGRFVDEQLRGPIRRLRHEHTFAATANGATVMTDVVEFDSPLGPLGCRCVPRGGGMLVRGGPGHR